MQERRTYIPQGWTKFYEFSAGDLAVCCETVSMVMAACDNNRKGQETTAYNFDWPTLHGVMESAVYGNRVDNTFDLRLVKEYLQTCFKGDALDKPRTGPLEIPPFQVPQSTQLSAYRALVEQMPDADNPVSIGLPANIDRAVQRINAQRVISQLRSIQSFASGDSTSSAHVDPKAWQAPLQPFFSFWDQQEKQFRNLKSSVRQPRPDDPPCDAFILMDIAIAVRIQGRVTTSLQSLQKVVRGQGMLTPTLQGEALALLAHTVPDTWMIDWPSAPEDPIAYLQQLAAKVIALRGSWSNKTGNAIFNEPISLADFLRPGVFLNALRQQTARAIRTAVDGLHLVSSFDFAALSARSNGAITVQVSGLLLEGALFDARRSVLVDSTRSAALTSPLPNLCIAWLPKDTHPEAALPGAGPPVSLPIYLSLSREHYLTSVTLHTDNARARILCAAAICLSEQ
jgi:dynein heavy chain 2